MFFGDDEKEEKEEALKKLKDVMLSGMGERFGSMKKPVAASMTIEKMPDDEMDDDQDEQGDDEDREGELEDEIEEDLEELQDLGRQHKKYCMGGKV